MEKIFSGKVYEVMRTTNGIIFSYLNRQFDDEKVEVAYKMLSLDNRRITDIAKNIYMITKLGNNYKAVEKLCDNYITAKSILLPGGRVFVLHDDGRAQLVDADGEPIWSGALIYKNLVPSDILLYNDGLWTAYEKANALVRYSLTNMRQELRIGGNNSPFDGPCSMFDDGEQIIVCNKNSKQLVGLNLDKFSLTELDNFEEPLYQYVKVDIYRFVVLESGLYVM
ncbi:MAG: hypothetical protein ACOYJS_06545 [Acutalibacteraceae bacterium]|jgi:hypothetical protein